MRRTNAAPNVFTRRTFCTSALGLLAAGTSAVAQGPRRSNRGLVEPLYREARAKTDIDRDDPANKHPLDPALALAQDGLQNIRENVRDYSATLVKRERIDGTIQDYEYMFTKIRNEKVVDERVVTPFSVYLYFLKPEKLHGREVLYVSGENDGKMIAHEPPNSLKGKFGSIWLKPDGALAMRGNRYPISEIGLETLVRRLIEKGNRDKRNGSPEECVVEFRQSAKINGCKCTLLRVTHPYPRDYYDFHVAEIFIDDARNVPLRYAAYQWPTRPNGAPELIEEYTYLNLKLNVGFTDEDFDYTNPSYNF
ncbi:MAG: DUF1571 domain-containing protein [Planctomycetota bacterium]